MSILKKIKSDVDRVGSNRKNLFFIKSGNKARIRFLDDLEDGYVLVFHDRWEPALNVPCEKNFNPNADCPYCGAGDLRTREQYCWSVWDYDSGSVQLFLYPANQCSPVPGLAALFENYGTITDRDYSISRSGKDTNTTYSLIPLDKSSFRNKEAKKYTKEKLFKVIKNAFVVDNDDSEDDNQPWDEADSEYADKTPKELFKLCKEKDLDVEPKKSKEYYINKLKDLNEDDDEFWEDVL